MKKNFLFSVLLIVLILSSVGMYTAFFGKQKADVNQKEEFNITSVKNLTAQNEEDSTYLTGKIVPNEISKLNADSTKGVISEVYVKVGDSVKKGQKLFSYNNPESQSNLLDAQTNTSKAQNKINSLTQTINSKTTQLNSKKNELADVKQKISVSKEEDKSALKQNESQLEETINTLQTEIDSANSDLNDANLDLEKATQDQNIQQQKNDQETVVSTVDGIVQKVDETQVNTTIGTGNTSSFMEVMDTSSFKVQGNVSEYKKDDLALNQKVKIIDRQDQNKTWPGKIVKIDPIAKEEKDDNTISSYPFEVLMDGNNNVSSIGNHVYVQPEKQNNTKINIPTLYVFKEKDKSYVWKVTDKKAFKQEVTIGTQKDDQTEIKTGLTATDEIIVPTSKITNGLKVK
ncbi:TPA: efflux RND transporter periplasmic adaptor subunit [Enterococcus faecalis]|uniref:efflux RND transporter periplasmic adaptor subunit n=1 Tax=Enterococcus faecalis TaxID=1351 RepID=UPI001CB1E125|nr:efflux RND transporter periplasmic adaptor subunit [Enterococcus faecalis]HBI3769139.1 efflux RND transporter periplasmic adaptor subunit [Enterococcus faecalis]